MDNEDKKLEQAAAETPNEAQETESPAPEAPAAEERYAVPEIGDDPKPKKQFYDEVLKDDDDEAPTEWVPTRFEKRIHAIPEKQWNLYQILGGAVIGLFTVVALFYGGSGISAPFLAAVILALLLPNWLEDRGRRKLTKGRYAMIIVIAVGLVVMVLYMGFTQGWSLFTKKEEEVQAALRLLRM